MRVSMFSLSMVLDIAHHLLILGNYAYSNGLFISAVSSNTKLHMY